MPPVTRNILIANAALFLVQEAVGDAFVLWFALWPLGGPFMPWQVVTYAFLHANLMHIVFNMLGVYSFGMDLERLWGPRRFLTYYLVCAVAAAATQMVFAAMSGSMYPTVGASGAVFGLLLAYAVLFPHRKLILLIAPVPVPARIFAVVYAVIELVLGVTGTAEGIAHFAHLGGMLGGLVMLGAWRRRRD